MHMYVHAIQYFTPNEITPVYLKEYTKVKKVFRKGGSD